jgi:broad specificity phosphatase PhoE
MSRILLARHGLTDWNLHHRFQGQSDLPLNDLGSRQALALAQRLGREPIGRILTSDLRRAQETARTIAVEVAAAAGVAPTIETLPELREVSFGDWEGLTYAEIEARAPAELTAWQADQLHLAPPDGESLTALAERVARVREICTAAAPDETILIVAHGGPLQTLICDLLGLPVTMYWQFHLSPASLSELRLYPQGAILNLINDTCHLHGLGQGGY